MTPTPTTTRVRPSADRRSQRIGIVCYLVLTFALTWLPFLPAAIGRDRVAAFLMPLAPAVACVVVRLVVTGEGFGDAGLRPHVRRWRTYLLAVTWPIAVVVVSVTGASMLRTAPSAFALPWGLDEPSPTQVLRLFVLSIAAAPIFLGEELGWRGYLQLRLFPSHPLRAALATGLIWGVWHYPMVLGGGEPTESIAQTLLLLPVSTMAMSVLLGWMRSQTGSLWPGTVAHAANNVTSYGLTSLAFKGTTTGTLPASASVPVLVASQLYGARSSLWALDRAMPPRLVRLEDRRLSMPVIGPPRHRDSEPGDQHRSDRSVLTATGMLFYARDIRCPGSHERLVKQVVRQ